MIFVDDGVVSDFVGWVKGYGEGYLENDEILIGFMVREYEKCFLESKAYPDADIFFSMLRACSDCYVLSAIASLEIICKFCAGDIEKAIMVADTLRENKYIWFERHGVPRHKVIIVEGNNRKYRYCKPGDILFDNKKRTIEKWLLLGGQGILVDRSNPKFDLSSEILKTIKAPGYKDYKIGDIGPGGGYVFYDKGFYADGWRYIEAAPENISTFSSLAVVGGGTSKEIGKGKSNTELTYSMFGNKDYAETACKNYCHNGLSDWFLPSLNELDLMLKNLKMHDLGGRWRDVLFAPDGEHGEVIPSGLTSMYSSSTALSFQEFAERKSFKSLIQPLPEKDDKEGYSFTWLENFHTDNFSYAGEQLIFPHMFEYGIVVRPARYF